MNKVAKIESSLPDLVKEANTVTSIEQIYKSSFPTLRNLGASFGSEKLQALVELKIVDALEFFNLKQSMNERQIQQTAYLIVSEYSNLSIADINLCFRNALLCKYGKNYSYIDGQVILGWVKQYVLDRSNEFEDLAEREHHSRKKQPIAANIAAKIKEAIKPKEVEVVNKKEPLQPSQLEQDAWDEFDKLHKEQKLFLPGTKIPMVKYNGLNLDVNGFVQVKLNEAQNTKA